MLFFPGFSRLGICHFKGEIPGFSRLPRHHVLTAMQLCALMAQEPKPLPKTVLFSKMYILHFQENITT